MRWLVAILAGVPIALLIGAVVYFMMVIGWILVLGSIVVMIVMAVYVMLTPTKNKPP